MSFGVKGGLPKNNSFFMQYLSLILIILVFSVGAFLRGGSSKLVVQTVSTPQRELNNLKTVNHSDFKQQQAKKLRIVRKKLSEIAYDNIFLGEAINSEVVDPLSTILKNHNVNLRFKILPVSNKEDDYNLALSQAIQLSNYLIELELPKNSWQVLVAAEPLEVEEVKTLFQIENMEHVQATISLIEFKEQYEF